MDDQRFDDSIKNKVGDYEYPGFEPAALASLHQQMAAASVVPWYSLYRTELLVGSGLVASTLIILWSQWFMSSNTSEILNEKGIAIQNQQDQIDKLQNEILSLRNTPPDTIRIIEIREKPSSDYSYLLYRIKLLEAKAAKSEVAGDNQRNNVEISSEPSQQDPSMKLESENVVYPKKDLYRNLFSSRLTPRSVERKSMLAEPEDEAMQGQTVSQDLSAKTLRDLESHYQKGIGIRIGPALEVARGFYSIGDGEIGVGGGLLADFILSPSLSLETGLKYAHRVYDISDDELPSEELPGMDPSLGILKKIDVDSWIFEIPISLKYRYPISTKKNWLASLGYSSQIYGKQVFEYEYNIPGNSDATVNSDYESSHAEVYSGALNFSLGLSNRLKNKKILETSIYYQLGLGKSGIEENSVDYLGVRGVYWFTVR